MCWLWILDAGCRLNRVLQRTLLDCTSPLLDTVTNPFTYLETEKEEQFSAEEAVTKEEFQDEWTVPASPYIAVYLEVADWSEDVQGPSVSIQQFHTEDRSAQPTTNNRSTVHTKQATE
ncbi:hypothetical protein STEG23_025689 [Scotinomys teguina]